MMIIMFATMIVIMYVVKWIFRTREHHEIPR
jgi:hypothetical protein